MFKVNVIFKGNVFGFLFEGYINFPYIWLRRIIYAYSYWSNQGGSHLLKCTALFSGICSIKFIKWMIDVVLGCVSDV